MLFSGQTFFLQFAISFSSTYLEGSSKVKNTCEIKAKVISARQSTLMDMHVFIKLVKWLFLFLRSEDVKES